MNKPKRPRDTNQLAKYIVVLSTGDAEEEDPYHGKNPAAVGRLGGLKGGKARAKNSRESNGLRLQEKRPILDGNSSRK